MHAYRDLDDYLRTQHYKDGLNRCNRLLKKSTKDTLIHVYRARFLHALGQQAEAEAVIKSLTDSTARPLDAGVLQEIDTFLWEINQDKSYPASLSNGTDSTKLWTNITNSTQRAHQPALQEDRYLHAVKQQRWVDAGYALSNWRKIEPNRRDLRFAHVAVYQLIAEHSTDEMTVRMNSQLADRTIQQLMAEMLSPAEIKLIIKVLSRQKSNPRLHGLYKILKPLLKYDHLCTVALVDALKTEQNWESLLEMTNDILGREEVVDTDQTKSQAVYVATMPYCHRILTEADSLNDWRIWEAWLTANAHMKTNKESRDLIYRLSPKSKTRMLVWLWLVKESGDWEELLKASVSYYDKHKSRPKCYSELREFVLAMPSDYQRKFQSHISGIAKAHFAPDAKIADDEMWAWVAAEVTSMRIEYLLTIGQSEKVGVESIYTFVSNAIRLQTFERSFGGEVPAGFPELLTSAMLRAHETTSSQDDLIVNLTLLREIDGTSPTLNILRGYLYAKLGLYSQSLRALQKLCLREIQMETASHIGLTRISISYPVGNSAAGAGMNPKSARQLLEMALDMFPATIDRITDQQCGVLDHSRFDLLLELEDLRKSLEHSPHRRMLILELRRLDRLTNRTPDTKYKLHPAVAEMWTDDLQDGRDFTTCDKYDTESSSVNLERRLQDGGAVPDADWVRHHLWIDEICSLVSGGALLVRPYLDCSGATEKVSESPAFTKEEKAMMPHWRALGLASVLAMAPEQATSFGEQSQDIGQALQNLQTSVQDLMAKNSILSAVGEQHLLSASTVQGILLQMDFLKAIERFVATAGKSTNLKKFKPTLSQTLESAATHFANLRKHAVAQRAKLDVRKLASSIEHGWEQIMLPSDADKRIQNGEDAVSTGIGGLSLMDPKTYIKGAAIPYWADQFVASARDSLDGILQIKFER